MAIAAAELAPEAAGAAEGLSPEASSAVSAARAGNGKRLSPEVAKELRARAARKPKAAPSPQKSSPRSSSSGGGGGSRVAGAFNALPAGGSSKAGHFITRAILAFGAFLLALELASYLSGRYFTWNLGKGVAGAQAAAKHLDLYPGQSAKLASQNLPVSSGAPAGTVGTKAV